MVIGQPAQNQIRGNLILFYIKLTAIAGGEDRSFAAVGESAELLQGLNQLLRVKATRSRTSTEAVLWLIPSARKAIQGR
jgi:hypothetical protein